MSSLGRSFDRHDPKFSGPGIEIFRCHLSIWRSAGWFRGIEWEKGGPFIVQIRLVSDQDNDNILSSFVTDIIYPFRRVVERCTVWVYQFLDSDGSDERESEVLVMSYTMTATEESRI